VRQAIITAKGHDVHVRFGRDELVVTGPDDMQFGDEYHTMHELYQHRMALNIALFNAWAHIDLCCSYYGITVGKAKLHHDGTMFEGGYFVVFAKTSEGQITYHYKLEHWDKFKIPEYERVPFEYDGHRSLDVLERLKNL
jgi:hypothetical protein